jgi:hypothetical protein
MNPNAYNAGNYGLFQVNAIHVSDPSALYDPETNVATAYRLYLARGWQPWGPCGAR